MRINSRLPPRISIVIPSFNQGKYIEEAILSIIDQEYQNLELIVIDGGSKDTTIDILHKYDRQISYWVSEPDEGQTHALIKGFNRATGEIGGWLGSDDLHEKHTLHEVAEFFGKYPDSKVVFGDSSWIDAHGHPIRPKREHTFSRFIWMYDYNYIPQPSTFWRMDIYRQVGGVDRKFDLAMDADLWIRFHEVTRLEHVRKYWSRMRYYPEQKNRSRRGESNSEDRIIRRRYIDIDSRCFWILMKLIAKPIRIVWKLFGGSYWWGQDNPFVK